MAETDQDAFLSRRVGARAVDHRPPDVGRLELDSSSLSHFIQAANRATSERGKLVDLADHFSAYRRPRPNRVVTASESMGTNTQHGSDGDFRLDGASLAGRPLSLRLAGT
jgi:hypothetical protein